ncbi:hypothetical protein OIU85_002920 [Salix viminalis]|uniref:GPI-anchored protein LLG1-like domain-containing protein n=1 Tax=Salix viminalis TaxID=40686 RepID=A0A9Q0VPD7_SALVM|nr:hypothetical protein OIU85_002920 [Salix viminalis]
MGLNRYFTFVFFIGVLTGLFASPSFASTFISDGVFESHASLGRNLLQTKKACPVNFEFLNYTIITSQCKGPLYLPGRCCGAFKDFACPYADVLNDLTNDCASIMFSYINLYGKYPPGLFANECKDGKLGLACPALPPSELANDQKCESDHACSASPADALSCFLSCKQHWLQLWELKNLVDIINCCYRMASFLAVSPLPMERNLLLTTSTTPDAISSLRMCHSFQEVKQLHAQFVVSGLLGYNPLCARRLLEAYATMPQIYYAISIFERMPSPDVFVYNTMIRGLTMGVSFFMIPCYCTKNSYLGTLFQDNYTYTFVLKACSHLKAPFEGKQVHCQIIKAGIVPDTYIHSSLIHMYANSGSIHDAERVLGEFSEENTLAKNAMISGYLTEGRVDKARRMFDNMTARDAASWSALIAGYTKNGMHTEALALFPDMMVSQILPNEAALVSLLSSCGQLGTLHQGRWVHGYVDKTRVLMSTKLTTALIDMYAKCGSIECGYGLFQKMAWRDVLFDEMLADGIRPNEVIFVAILSACSHAGCVEEGRQYFSQMEHGFGIKPSIEHYGCMVDLLGRAGLLADAEELILSMPEQPNSIIWGSLLSACRTHNDLRRGTWAFENLMELEPTSGDRYKLAGLMFRKCRGEGRSC